MKFTKEEISLCKQVAGKYRKKLVYGDWWIGMGEAFMMNILGEILHPKNQHKDIIPLWTISDCLEFLRERSWANYQFSFDKKGITEVHIVQTPFNFRSNQEIVERGTFLEVLLKAVLAVLGEKK